MEACRKDVKGVVEMISQKSQIYSRIYNISQYLDRPLLLAGANQLRRKAAAGTDRVSPKWYRENLDININKLIEEVKNKTYQPYPARRVSIPKDDGSLRYLGIPDAIHIGRCSPGRHLDFPPPRRLLLPPL